ncbi:MAG: methyltransferase domain-containing protein [Proteobacteria bacterium]|nr:methyltransferase domain-containing protein [Pseudomonadota bacterium]
MRLPMTSPDLRDADVRQALLCYQEGRFDEARRSCVDVLQHEGHAGALHLLALVDLSENRLDDALVHAHEALALRPSSAPVLNTLGAICLRRGDESGAEQHLRQALEVDPGLSQAQCNLASLLHRRGVWSEAREHYARALVRPSDSSVSAPLPDDVTADDLLAFVPTSPAPDLVARRGWLDCLSRQVLMPLVPAVRDELVRCFEVAGLDLQLAGTLVFQALTHHRSWPAVAEAARVNDESRLRELSAPLWGDRLLNLALRFSLCTDVRVEAVLTAWRRLLAMGGAAEHRGFVVSMALQCQLNELVFAVTPQEHDAIAAFERVHDDDGVRQAVVAMYRPFRKGLDRLRQRGETVADLTEVCDAVSREVRDQYEVHPYPRWLSLPQRPVAPFRAMLQHSCGYVDGEADNPSTRVLSAGCGTGRVALTFATQIAGAEVLAVDLSRASLAYATEMAARLGIRNVDFRHGDILELAALSERFDVIDCVGVLHHLEDPMRGWRVLRERLVSRGFMRVGLYSRAARAGVNAARALATGIDATDTANIRRWRQAVLQLPEDDVARDVTKTQDFYVTSACRDLAFHVCEHQFDLPQIATMLAALDLELIGFEFTDPRVLATYHALFGDDASRVNLTFWEAFERLYPSTFLGMYTFWCRRRG